MAFIHVDRYFFYSSSDERVVRELGKTVLGDMPPSLSEYSSSFKYVNSQYRRFIQLTRSFVAMMMAQAKGYRPRFDSARGKSLLTGIGYKLNGDVLTMTYVKHPVASINIKSGCVTVEEDPSFQGLVMGVFFDKKCLLNAWESLSGLVEDIEDVTNERVSNSLWDRVVNKTLIAVQKRMVEIADTLLVFVMFKPTKFLKILIAVFKDGDVRIAELDKSGEYYRKLSLSSSGNKLEMFDWISKLAFLKADHLRLKSGNQPEKEECLLMLNEIIEEYLLIKEIPEKQFKSLRRKVVV